MAHCRKPHRYLPLFASLPDSQAGVGRHKCAACAYEQGYDHGFDHLLPNFDGNVLDESQAGEVRHKDTEAAYNLGYYHGLEQRRNTP